MLSPCYIMRKDARLLSPCCLAPQDVAFGEITINPTNAADWSQRILHLCSACGREFDPEYGITPVPLGLVAKQPGGDTT